VTALILSLMCMLLPDGAVLTCSSDAALCLSRFPSRGHAALSSECTGCGLQSHECQRVARPPRVRVAAGLEVWAAQGGEPGRACSAMERSRPKSWVLDSGRRMSFCSRDPRFPPTQYSRISHRWLVVSYLQSHGSQGFILETASEGAPEGPLHWNVWDGRPQVS